MIYELGIVLITGFFTWLGCIAYYTSKIASIREGQRRALRHVETRAANYEAMYLAVKHEALVRGWRPGR